MKRIFLVAKSFQLESKPDGIWLRLEHPHIGGKAAFNLGPDDHRIFAQVARHFEAMRTEAIAADEKAYDELTEAASMLVNGAHTPHPDAGEGYYVSGPDMDRLRKALADAGIS